MVVRGFGPFAGWDLDDPTEITNLMEVLEVMLLSVPDARVRNRRVFRPYNDAQFASLEGLVDLAERSPPFRTAVNVFNALNEEVNTAILVRAAQELQTAAASAGPAPRNVPAVAGNGANLYLRPASRPISTQESSMSSHMLSNMAGEPEQRDGPPRRSRIASRSRPAGPVVIPIDGFRNPNRPMRPSPLGQNLYGPGGATPTNRPHMGSAPPPVSYPMPGQPGFGSQRPLMPRPGPPLGTGRHSQTHESQEDDDDEDEDNYTGTPSGKKVSSTSKPSGGKAKHKPRKPRNEQPIDENIDKENAKVGEEDLSKLRINYYTRKKDGTRGDLVINKYGHKVDFNSRDSVKKLNAWRSQIVSRNFNQVKKKREYWLVLEREKVMKLIREQFSTRSTLKWAKLANDYNKKYNGQIQPAGCALLHDKKRVNRTLRAPRPTPWRTRASIEHAAAKWKEYLKMANEKKAEDGEGVKTDASGSPDDNSSVHYSEDEVELKDPNPTRTVPANPDTPTPASTASGAIQKTRKKPPGRPISKPINRKRPHSTSTVSDESESDHESSPEPEPKCKKHNPRGRKRGGNDDDTPTFPNLPPRRPAA